MKIYDGETPSRVESSRVSDIPSHSPLAVWMTIWLIWLSNVASQENHWEEEASIDIPNEQKCVLFPSQETEAEGEAEDEGGEQPEENIFLVTWTAYSH